MNQKDRNKASETLAKRNNGQDWKAPRWKTICIETKDSPHKPRSLITGEVECIFGTGDICFKKIIKIELWYPETDKVEEIKIPSVYLKAKKHTFRREIIASLIYLEELEVRRR